MDSLLHLFCVSTVGTQLFWAHVNNVNNRQFPCDEMVFQIGIFLDTTFYSQKLMLVYIRKLVIIPGSITINLFDSPLRVANNALL
jgi:hypothetical protein